MPTPPSLFAVLAPTEAREFFPEPMFGQLRSLLPEFRLLDPTGCSEEEFARQLAAADPDILLGCWKTPRLPDALPPRLRYVCYLTGSVKKLLTRAHLERGLLVTNWGGSISRTVAEAAIFHVISCLRNATHWAIAMHQPGVAAWKTDPADSRSLFCRSVGLHGFGPVARELVGLLKPWQCPIAVFAPDLTPELAQAYGVRPAESLDELFSRNEIIVELAPLIPATRGVVTERLLRLIPAGGVFVNVGRGAVVDEAALLRVAGEGRISVGLDVFSREPLPADSGFRALPRVGLTPHTAGPTIDRYPDAGQFALNNLRAHLAGNTPAAIVTPVTYDQST
ncbi:MAG: hydroxyacid dehydrogenase [Verrucomicrobia bacterium]|nr:hydroxyacid dehydrogenase [Verrucomicrobiota bacterium]